MQKKITWTVEGLSDEHSSKKVGHALQEVWGIVSVDDFHFPRNEVTFTYDDHAAAPRDFRESLKEHGFDTNGGSPDDKGM
jgi:copper chaperone CopZ